MRYFITICFLSTLLISCKEGGKNSKSTYQEPEVTNLTGHQLAKIHCAVCHTFVPPEKLSKSIWAEDVLPAMGHRLGIFDGAGPPDSLFGSPRNAEIIEKTQIFPEQPLIAKTDWSKIEAYYLKNAPENLLAPRKGQEINRHLKQFKYREISYGHPPPLTAMVKIRENGRGLIFSDGKPKSNVLTFLDGQLQLEKNILVKNTPIQYYEKSDTIYLTSIGQTIFPNDLSDGTLQKVVNLEKELNQLQFNPVLSNLQRPVFTAYGDVTGNGKEDIVACEFGDLTGKLVLYEQQADAIYSAKILKQQPGAIKTVIKDQNRDGLNDIIVLMAQGDEGIFYFESKGGGSFEEKRLLRFSPLNGSQNFELVDFNGDGHDDIVYVCGDNADKTPILKDYHGVYLFLNDGNLNFTQAYFFRQNGAYKAIPLDFDKDGDIDIASISFFPDYRDHPEESFVYLENKGNMIFEPYSFDESNKGRWIVMDAGDIDGDGDIDLALGSFVYFLAKDDTTGLSKRWLKESPSVIILENTLKP